jgi:hypothetical protein
VGLFSIIIFSCDIYRYTSLDVDEPLFHLAEPVLHLHNVSRRLLRVCVGLKLHGFLSNLPVDPDDLSVAALLPDRICLRDVLLPCGLAGGGLAVRDQDHPDQLPAQTHKV